MARNTRPRGSVVAHGPDRWRLFVELAPDPVTGRRRRASKVISAASRRAALDAWPDFAAEVRAGTARSRAKPVTVDELLDAWLEGHQIRESTRASWRADLRRYVRPHLGGRRIDDVDTYTLDVLYRRLEASGGQHGRPLAPSTVRRAHVLLRLAFAQAIRWHWLAHNPATDASPPSGKRQQAINPPDAAARAALTLAAAEFGPAWPVALRVAIVTGCRREELCALQWGDVDLDAGTVTFRRTVVLVGSQARVVDMMKTDASMRTVAIGPATTTILKAWRRHRLEQALAAGIGLTPDAWLFSRDLVGRRHWHPSSVSHRFGDIRRRAGLTGIRLYDLRHAFVTESLVAGVDVRTIAGRGGWADPSTLLRIYAAWVPAADRAAAELLDDIADRAT